MSVDRHSYGFFKESETVNKYKTTNNNFFQQIKLFLSIKKISIFYLAV